ncbi:SDR family NAD(P)-dependent oxidoreductase [Amnibacterium setariae]|uniref:SDR family NAD(P)-dependent oxidoreductase n=1 Tax=Amnibacterium setariae TaxID=2306585 RepID=A0A3A1U816_9MICO|nr:SDR family NAD(P)-dependent oxidoreductase [Amnibacterium setariae]RIX31198.1 SDR family NAD(P)-dependent oxidoreductase [Amnibacterium setariae]
MATALVTGATSGIGAAFARALAARGWDLVLVARDEDRLEEEAARYRAAGRGAEVLRADLTDRGDVDRVAARLEDSAAPVDLLVNNAGFSVRASLLSTDQAAHDRAFEVMVRAVQVLSGAAGRAMTARGRGRIVNVGSTAGRITMGAYSAIKAWVTVYTEGLANELAGTGVTAMALEPGWVRTEFHARAGISGSSMPDALWLDADDLVAAALRDLLRGRVVSTPSARYKALMFVARHAPRSGIRRVSKALSDRRRSSLPE